MNEEQANQEKEFRSILNALLVYGESRDKLISEIDEIIDRIAENRKPSATLIQKEAPDMAKTPAQVVIPTLRQRVREMDLANERLKAISNRLNELV